MAGEIWVEPSRSLNGTLRFQGEGDWPSASSGLLDEYQTLRRPEDLPGLEALASSLGMTFRFVGDAADRLALVRRVATEPFECSSPFLRDRALYPFQHAGMNLAYILPRTLIQWDTGAGKTVAAALVAQRLFDDGTIRRVVVFCRKSKRLDWERFLAANTSLRVRRVDGEKAARRAQYAAGDWDALVLNYEKARSPRRRTRGEWRGTDLREVLEAVSAGPTLIVLDEAQRAGNAGTLTWKGLRSVVEARDDCRAMALTATPFVTSPYNVHAILSLIDPEFAGTRKAFEDEYVRSWNVGQFGRFPVWDESRLPLLGRRIAGRTHVAMKSDPAIAAQFPEMTEREVVIGMSPEDREVYDWVAGAARGRFEEAGHAENVSNLQLLRMVCCTPESLRWSGSRIAEEALARFPWASSGTSEKFRALSEMLEAVAAEGQKAVVFSFWANSVLIPLRTALTGGSDGGTRARAHARGAVTVSGASQGGTGIPSLNTLQHKNTPRGGTAPALDSRGNPVYSYTGSMGEADRQAAVDGFNGHDGPAVLLCSDAGQEGLNLYAPYLFHLEMPWTYAAYRQRRDRIHRADSRDRGIERVWVYRFLVAGTVEERIDRLVMSRRGQAEAIQGVEDVASDRDSLTADELRSVLFG